VQGITVLILFVLLNLLYLLTCLPVVTIGAATSSLFEVTSRYADHERGDLVRGYLAALRRNAGPGTAVFLLLMVPALMLVFSGAFWLSMDGALTAAAGGLAILGAAYLGTALLYGLALVGSFTSPVGQTVRNALLLPLAEPARTLGLLLIPLAGALLLYVWPASVVLALTVGFSVGAYLCSLVLRGVFARRQAGEIARERVSPHSGE
jgi:uncharacterized membrane protein YesL